MPGDRQVTQKKRFYSARRKLQIIQERVENNWTFYQSAKHHGLQSQQIKRWEKSTSLLKTLIKKSKKGQMIRSPQRCKEAHAEVESRLLEYIEFLRERDIGISYVKKLNNLIAPFIVET
jgi:transposase-like protein